MVHSPRWTLASFPGSPQCANEKCQQQKAGRGLGMRLSGRSRNTSHDSIKCPYSSMNIIFEFRHVSSDMYEMHIKDTTRTVAHSLVDRGTDILYSHIPRDC